MDLPSKRCILNAEVEEGNLRWLSRNIQINSSEHPQFQEAKGLIRELLVSQYINGTA